MALAYRPARLPNRLRLAVFGAAVAVLLYLCLAPSKDLPEVSLWDKAEHALAWAVLSGLGLALWPARPWRIGLFAIALGAVVEILQGVMDLGRDADVRDLLADGVGVLAALLVWRMLRARLV